MVRIRQFRARDLASLLEFWNRAVRVDRLTPKLLKEKVTEDPDFDPELTLIAEHAGEIAGFMMGVTRRSMGDTNRGWIKLFAVARPHRRKGIASELLSAVEELMRQRGVKRLQVMDCPVNYLHPGIDPLAYTEAICFAERRGFKKVGDTSHLKADLRKQDFDTSAEERKLAKEGIEIRRARPEDWPHVEELLRSEWAAWVPEVKRTLGRRPISLHVALLDGRIEAFSAYDANNVGTGWFGPMGTRAVFRGKGVGGILLKRCLRDMQRQGLPFSTIPWVGPIPFYMHYCNAHVYRVFWRYAKELA
ncbi:MAG: GNAT family N-acetyltransferase [candidate division KSB1 bacterium]|nr:GNAT family N-acetyltransferase [candidate division KSB1 bacterium]